MSKHRCINSSFGQGRRSGHRSDRRQGRRSGLPIRAISQGHRQGSQACWSTFLSENKLHFSLMPHTSSIRQQNRGRFLGRGIPKCHFFRISDDFAHFGHLTAVFFEYTTIFQRRVKYEFFHSATNRAFAKAEGVKYRQLILNRRIFAFFDNSTT